MEKLSSVMSFNGQQLQLKHSSDTLKCDMQFSVFLPPQAETQNVPVLYWLSGLTCTDQNFVTKAGAQRAAAKLGIAIVCPDTSPRGDDIPDDPDGAWDFGLGAGFYVNATQAPWSSNYRMYDYIVDELPKLIENEFPLDSNRRAISGHSMGGHGALVIALRNTEHYRSVSAFSPIVSPINCPWGQKALSLYLGDDKHQWLDYDSCELIKTAQDQLPILVDQGSSDSFLKEQLKTDLLRDASNTTDYPITVRMQEGYDHSYFFIATFIEDHLRFHAEHCDYRIA